MSSFASPTSGCEVKLHSETSTGENSTGDPAQFPFPSALGTPLPDASSMHGRESMATPPFGRSLWPAREAGRVALKRPALYGIFSV